ncbi:hypothetical protein U9M48_033292 [Paspalum notatum var. saurae]|uniref:Uncharacterized protein n=1 Tax=Paspalum notatum var. saurae TaxID=547442 RepID=A0AAQ3X6H4_PASNO
MALRSLVVKMKALPRRVPGPRAFVNAPKPKDDPWHKIIEEYENASKYSSTKEFTRAIEPMLEDALRATKEKSQRRIWRYRGLAMLITVGGFGSAGYLRARL